MGIYSVNGTNPLMIAGMSKRKKLGRGVFKSVPLTGAPKISGITRDSNSNPLGSCSVTLYRTNDDVAVQQQTSDPSTGAFAFYVVGGGVYYIVAYLMGAPDIAGTTIDQLTAQ